MTMRLLCILLLTATQQLRAVEPTIGMKHHERAVLSLEVPELEWRHDDEGNGAAWDAALVYGGDHNKLVLRTEGERRDDRTEENELFLQWQRAWLARWYLHVGAREELAPADPRTTWASIGLSGELPGFIGTSVTLFQSEYDQTELRLELDHETFLTQRVVLEPEVELRAFRQDQRDTGVGSGLAESELGLRLKYEIYPDLAPYLGITRRTLHGRTADWHGESGVEDSEVSFVLGIDFWL